jgi:hypothetical protein
MSKADACGMPTVGGLQVSALSGTYKCVRWQLTHIGILNNQHELEGSDVVAGQDSHANTRGRVGPVFTSSNEEETGEPLGAVCPLSVA